MLLNSFSVQEDKWHCFLTAFVNMVNKYVGHSLKVTKEGRTIISAPTGLNEKVTLRAASKGVKAYFILVQSDGGDMKQIASLSPFTKRNRQNSWCELIIMP